METNLETYTISVNGKAIKVTADPDTPLLWVLRDNLNLIATKYGCGVGSCSACTVLVDGKAKRTCQLPIKDVGTKKIVTLEGLSAKGDHPVQMAWMEEDVPQCGYCQSGQILSAVALLKENKDPSDEDIDMAMSSNICRCGTYDRIRQAIKRAAKAGGNS